MDGRWYGVPWRKGKAAIWRKTGKILVKKSAGLISLIQSRRMSIDLDFFGLTVEVARPIAHSLLMKRRGGDS
jgi:hypothetical protein